MSEVLLKIFGVLNNNILLQILHGKTRCHHPAKAKTQGEKMYWGSFWRQCFCIPCLIFCGVLATQMYIDGCMSAKEHSEGDLSAFSS